MAYGRIIARDNNRLVQSCGNLLGIASGLLADRQLNDDEIRFLHQWMLANEEMLVVWPGDVLIARVRAVLADGIVTEAERMHLVETLQQIAGGEVPGPNTGPVNQLAFDEAPVIRFPEMVYCVTGDFVFGPRERVHEAIAGRGGVVLKNVTQKLNYLVVGMRGSEEWKHGSFGTKIEKAVEYRRKGLPIAVVREDDWTAALKAA
jgi:NAD-dependent DNA ligase